MTATNFIVTVLAGFTLGAIVAAWALSYTIQGLKEEIRFWEDQYERDFRFRNVVLTKEKEEQKR